MMLFNFKGYVPLSHSIVKYCLLQTRQIFEVNICYPLYHASLEILPYNLRSRFVVLDVKTPPDGTLLKSIVLEEPFEQITQLSIHDDHPDITKQILGNVKIRLSISALSLTVGLTL